MRIGGVTYIVVNGQQYTLAGKWDISESRVKREAKTGLSGRTNFVETPQARFVEGDFQADANLDPDVLGAIVDATVTTELANGRVVTLVHAFCEGDIKTNAADGTCNVKFVEQI